MGHTSPVLIKPFFAQNVSLCGVGGEVLILYLVSFCKRKHGGNVCVRQPPDGKSIRQRGYIQVYFASLFTVGSVMVKTFPSDLPSQRIFPPCSDTMLLAIESPRP